MALFGFLTDSPDPGAFDALLAHGAEVTGEPAGARASQPGLAQGACWAPTTLAQDSVLIALQGQPVWARGDYDEAASVAAVLAEYRRRGSQVVDLLAGRFALAIVNAGARRAVLAIDSMGIERMTWAVRGSSLVFASSAQAVADAPGIEAPLSKQALFDYLLLHVIPAPDTVFEGVQKLRPATCLTFEHGKVEIRHAWRPDFHDGRDVRFDTLRQELRSSLDAAVRSCRPDGRAGAFLSGGLDSSSVAGALSGIGPHPTRTFSIGFGYPQYDELPYARIANERFGCKGHERVIDGDDIAAAFPLIARAFDEPFGNSSALPVLYCARLAREHDVDHLLAGDGGDELFAGNSRYAEQRIFERYQLVPAPLRRGFLEPLLARWPESLAFEPVRRAKGYVEKANIPLPLRLESWNVVHRTGAEGLLHADLAAAVNPAAAFERMREVWNATPSANTLDRMLYFDWQYTLADNDLRKVETMSALAGVRVSYPMLHPRMIAMSLKVPPRMMMPGRQLRDFYKRAMRGFLPDAIIRKKKHGFGLPFGLWFAQNARLRELVCANLASLRERRLVRADFIDRLLDLHRSEDASFYGVFVWILAMLEQWLEEHRPRSVI